MSVENQDMRRHSTESAALEAEQWLARLQSPECSADDRARFQDWLAQHPSHWQAYHRAEQLWSAATQAATPELAALADTVLLRARRRRRANSLRRRVFGAVATVVVMVGVTAGLISGGWLTPEPATTYSTAIGESRSFTLSDGSVVSLNTDTVLQVRMSRRARTVELQRGEAQFVVAPDRQRPFKVVTPLAEVTALGTVFQVRNVDAATEVSLLEGRVQVAPPPAEAGRAPPQELAAGERLVARAGQSWERSSVDVEAANGWLSGRLVFNAIPLRQAVEEFNRYSQRKLRIDGTDIGDIAIDGVFNAGDTESIVLALQYVYALQAEDRGAEVVLRRR